MFAIERFDAESGDDNATGYPIFVLRSDQGAMVFFAKIHALGNVIIFDKDPLV